MPEHVGEGQRALVVRHPGVEDVDATFARVPGRRAALDLADRGYVLQTGRVVLEGRSEELRGSDLVRKAYLGM